MDSRMRRSIGWPSTKPAPFDAVSVACDVRVTNAFACWRSRFRSRVSIPYVAALKSIASSDETSLLSSSEIGFRVSLWRDSCSSIASEERVLPMAKAVVLVLRFVVPIQFVVRSTSVNAFSSQSSVRLPVKASSFIGGATCMPEVLNLRI